MISNMSIAGALLLQHLHHSEAQMAFGMASSLSCESYTLGRIFHCKFQLDFSYHENKSAIRICVLG